MQDSADYKLVDRRKFAVIMVLLVGLVAVVVWTSLDRLAAYGEHLEALAAAEPVKAAEELTHFMRTLAIVNGMVLSSLAALIVAHGWRGWRTAAMPPKGSWILEGQRTWSGEPAVRIGKFTIVVGALLAALAVASSWILWNAGDTLMAEASKHAVLPRSTTAPPTFKAPSRSV